MRREWSRIGPVLALCAAALVVGTAVVLAATASTTDRRAAVPASADLAAPPRGICLLGIIGDCGPRPTPTNTPPSGSASTPAPTHTETTAPTHQPTTTPTRPRHHHSRHARHTRTVRTTVPAQPSSTHHRTKSSLPVAATTSIDPTPAGTTISASDPVAATPDRGERQESTGMLRPLMQLLPVAAICLAIGLVVIITAARRGSRRPRATAVHGRRRHRHSYADTDELVHPRA